MEYLYTFMLATDTGACIIIIVQVLGDIAVLCFSKIQAYYSRKSVSMCSVKSSYVRFHRNIHIAVLSLKSVMLHFL